MNTPDTTGLNRQTTNRANEQENIEITESESAFADLRGAKAIAQFLWGDSGKYKRVYHLWQTSRAPFFKIGGMICARKAAVRRWIEDQEKLRLGLKLQEREEFSLPGRHEDQH
jgi:hypothetical protein